MRVELVAMPQQRSISSLPRRSNINRSFSQQYQPLQLGWSRGQITTHIQTPSFAGVFDTVLEIDSHQQRTSILFMLRTKNTVGRLASSLQCIHCMIPTDLAVSDAIRRTPPAVTKAITLNGSCHIEAVEA